MKLDLPNGTSIEVPDDITEEQKQKILDNIANNESYQSQEAQKIEDNAEQSGMIGDWRPEGAKTSWLFDNAVVAPYEASRKFINSTSSLAEGLGDTLGEKTNLGGFRYGKEASNGMMEYVPYDQAIKLGNVKGLINPFSGNIGKKDYSKIKGLFYDPDKINPEDNTESLTASFVEGGFQFVAGWVTGGKILKGLGVGTQSTRLKQFGKATTQGAIADFVGFDELSGRLTDMIVEHSPEMADTWLGYLQSDPNDTWWEGRMKNTIEGAGIGAFADVLMAGLRVSKGYISNNIDEKLIANDIKIIEDAKLNIEKSKGLLDGATTISDKMKILSDAMDNTTETIIYHGTGAKFKDFDTTKSADGSIWFTNLKSEIESGASGASSSGRIIARTIDENNLRLATREQSDKFLDDQLIQQGFDGIKLDDLGDGIVNYKIFNPKKLNRITKNKPKELITPAKRVILYNNIASKDLNVNYERWKKGEIDAEEAFSIPHNFLNIDVMESGLVTKSFIQTVKAMHEAVYKNFSKVDNQFSDEVIKRKAIKDYGGDVNKIYQEFGSLSKGTKNVSSLIYAHEMMLHSLIKALPAFQRQVKMGVGTRTQKDVDDTLNYILGMMKHKMNYGSTTGGNFRTLGIVKKELTDSKLVSENLEYALREYEEFGKIGGKEIKGSKEKLMQKLTDLDRPDVTRQILDFVYKNNTWEVLNEIWINALLSNPKTQLVNAIGNGITALIKPIEDKLGSNISAFLADGDIGKVARYNQLSQEAGSTFSGLFRYLAESLKMGGKAFRRGELILEGKEGMSKIDTGTNKATGSGVFGNTVRLPSRALNAGDETFKQINYRSKLETIATREGLALNLKGKELNKFVDDYYKAGFDESGRGLNEEALNYAREATYTNELTGFTKKFQEAVNEYPVLKQLFPFIRTPFQLAKSVVDRSPVAMTYRMKHLLGMTNDPKMIAKARGQMAMGTMLFSSAFIFEKMGIMSSSTNKVDDDKMLDKFKDSELMRFKKTETNFKPYSFIVNNVQVPFGRLDPYGAFFGIVADISTNYQKLSQDEIERLGADMQMFLFNQSENNPLSLLDKSAIATKSVFRATRDNLLSKTYLQTVHEIVNAMYSQDERAVKKYFSNKIGSYYPNVLTKILNDPYLRDATNFIDQVKMRTGLGTPAEPKFNFMGKPHKNPEGGFERGFNNIISPVTATPLEEGKIVAEELLRLGKAPQNLKKFNNNVDYSEYEYKGKSAYWRLNNYLNTVKIEGMTLEKKLEKVIQSDEYKSLTDPLKTDKTISDVGGKFTRIQEIYNLYKTQAEAKFRREWSLFKHVDDNKRNLTVDIQKQNINQLAITQSNRTDKSLIEKLQNLRNYK